MNKLWADRPVVHQYPFPICSHSLCNIAPMFGAYVLHCKTETACRLQVHALHVHGGIHESTQSMSCSSGRPWNRGVERIGFCGGTCIGRGAALYFGFEFESHRAGMGRSKRFPTRSGSLLASTNWGKCTSRLRVMPFESPQGTGLHGAHQCLLAGNATKYTALRAIVEHCMRDE
jgi:hypothetical protein